MRLAANYFEYIPGKKNQYLFRQGDLHENFYGIIRGKISLRVRVSNLIENSSLSFLNQNKFQKEKLKINEKNLNEKEGSLDTDTDHPALQKSKFNKFISSLSNDIKNELEISKNTANCTPTLTHNKSKIIKTLTEKIEFDLEKEVLTLSDGQCFGEWALLYNIPRTASAYILEESDLFI